MKKIVSILFIILFSFTSSLTAEDSQSIKRISVGEDCLLGANSGLGIPLGDRCIVEAGLYLTGGSKVEVLNAKGELIEVTKAANLSSKSDLLFIRNSLTGSIQCKPNHKNVQLNETLHNND